VVTNALSQKQQKALRLHVKGTPIMFVNGGKMVEVESDVEVIGPK